MDCTSVLARGRRLLTPVVLLLSLAAGVEAQAPVPVYEVGAGELSIDGSLEDWRRLSIPPVVTELDFIVTPHIAVQERPRIPPPGAPDLTFEVRLAWSAEPSRIFAAFEIADDHYLEAAHPDYRTLKASIHSDPATSWALEWTATTAAGSGRDLLNTVGGLILLPRPWRGGAA